MDDMAMKELRQAIERNTEASLELMKAIRSERNPWLDPDETAHMLGIKISKSRHHRRRIAKAVERGFLTKVRPGKPPAYWKAEVRELAIKLAAGEAVI